MLAIIYSPSLATNALFELIDSSILERSSAFCKIELMISGELEATKFDKAQQISL